MRDCSMVVGSGMMGSGIGAMSSLAGNRTVLVGVDEDHVKAGFEKACACIRQREENGLKRIAESAFMAMEAIINS